MKLFCDTEFTDFIDTQLISIGMVTEDGREFYREVADYDKKAESQWVRANVIPLLNGGEAVKSRLHVADDLFCWISKLGTHVELCVDYITDWDLVVDLLDEMWPLNMANEPIMLYPELQAKTILKYTSKDTSLLGGAMPEFALSDAISDCRKVFSDTFLDYFYRGIPLGYKQHHALHDARANLQGYQAAMKFIEAL